MKNSGLYVAQNCPVHPKIPITPGPLY